eukprot:TRINITY_DN10721_c0_g1_i1.p1 TRINITY_DN10721_c0_g1~~TRINITY_DN10721_c0_g1_i1.p1  ORF type:complete len:655 (+),score=90.89 TRINITY_DN10721_c0_g1_i1:891-2855(+)
MTSSYNDEEGGLQHEMDPLIRTIPEHGGSGNVFDQSRRSTNRRMSAPVFHVRQPGGIHQSGDLPRSVTVDPAVNESSFLKRIKSAESIQGAKLNYLIGLERSGKSLSNNALYDSLGDKLSCRIRRADSANISRRRKSSLYIANRLRNRQAWNITIACLVVIFFFGPWALNEWIEWGSLESSTPKPRSVQSETTTIVVDSNIAQIFLCFNGTSPPQLLTVPPDTKQQDTSQRALATAEMLQPGIRFPLQQVLNQTIWMNMTYVYNESALPEKYFPDEIRNFHTKMLRRGRMEQAQSGVAIPMDRDSKEYKQMVKALQRQGKSALIVDNPFKKENKDEHANSSCPASDRVRLFMAITTRCCTGQAAIRRDAIRNTWLKTAREKFADSVTIKFVIAQPPLEDIGKAYELLQEEVQQHNDIIFVPGLDTYRNLPNKTLRLLQYAMSSPCEYTHVMKTDDDVYMRMANLVDLLHESADEKYLFTGGLAGIDRPPSLHGFQPVRNVASKWYVSYEELPEEISPTGVPYAEGWGYILSRDAATYVLDEVIAVTQETKPAWSWWGRLPWEDVMIGAILQNVTTVQNCKGFKSAWGVCEQDTIIKHLDIDSPGLLQELYAQENNGVWDRSVVQCNTGDFKLGSADSWRAWRNRNLPIGQLFLD